MIKRKLFIFIVIILGLIIIAASQYPKLYIATGYGAKTWLLHYLN